MSWHISYSPLKDSLIKQMEKIRKGEKDIVCQHWKQWNLMSLILKIVCSRLILYFACLLIIIFNPLFYFTVYYFYSSLDFFLNKAPPFSYNLELVHGSCLFKFGDRGAGARCGLCNKDTTQWCSSVVFLVSFECIFQLILELLLLTFSRQISF